MTSQVQLDSYADAGVLASVDLVNGLALGSARGAPRPARPRSCPAIARVLAVDPPSVARLSEADGPGFVALAHRLHEVFDDLARRRHRRGGGPAERPARQPPGAAAPRQGGRAMAAAPPPRRRRAGLDVDVDLRRGHGPHDRRRLRRSPRHLRRRPAAAACSSTSPRTAAAASARPTCQNRVKAAAFRLRRGSAAAPAQPAADQVAG